MPIIFPIIQQNIPPCLGPLAKHVGYHGSGGVGDSARHLVPLVAPVTRLDKLYSGGEAGLGAPNDTLPVQVHPALRPQDVVDAAGHLVPHVFLAMGTQTKVNSSLRLKLHGLAPELGPDP